MREIGFIWPDLGGADVGQELLVIAVMVAVALVLIPVLLFSLELIILGVLLAAGVLARTLLGEPWVVEAISIDPPSSGRRLEWQVRGWRRSQTLIAEIADELAAGKEPSAPQPRR